MKTRQLTLSAVLLSMALVSCSHDNVVYNEPIIGIGSADTTEVVGSSSDNGTAIYDEWGNCKSSPYTKFYEGWEKKEGWENGMERVYDAWITLDYHYWVQVIKCEDSETHKYKVINYEIGDRETFIKYMDTEKGYGGRKGMLFNNEDAL